MTIAFTGHRNFDGDTLYPSLYDQLREVISEDEITFLSGMAMGFDLAAAEAVISLRKEFRHIRLKCVIPYSDQAKYFSAEDKSRYNRVLECADEVITLESEYSKLVFLRRNDYLVKSADLIIAYYDRGGKGGTAYTVHKAKRARVALQNLYPDAQLSLF